MFPLDCSEEAALFKKRLFFFFFLQLTAHIQAFLGFTFSSPAESNGRVNDGTTATGPKKKKKRSLCVSKTEKKKKL